jgi:2-polyprenyl-6-methoxyphenol hydroxylase-like FAD-dependent oxidoreductase
MRIAICGAGIAGPTLAYWLHRSGRHEITLIEKAPHFRTGGYILDFWGTGYTVAERMGILPEVRATGYSVQELRMVDDRGRKVGGFSTGMFRKLLNDRFTSLPRGDLALTIYRTIEGRVETIFGNTISAIEERVPDVHVSFEHGPPRAFDLLIGADGLHSVVRNLTFGHEQQFETQLGYHIAAFEVVGYKPRDELVYVSFALPGRQVSRFSLRGDRTLFLLAFVSDYMTDPEPHNIDERKSLVHRVFGDAGWECPQILNAMHEVKSLYFDSASQIKLDRWSKGRVILIGDAGACVSLLAGEGAGLAMTEAYVLAGELKRAGHDYQAAFHQYEQRMRLFIEGKQKSAKKFAAAFAPRTRLGIWFRNQVTKLVRIPFVAKFFLGRVVRDDFDLPNYEL